VTTAVSSGEERLVALMADAARGPARDGLYALWVTLRVAEGLVPPNAVSPRGHRRRLQALAARMSTLTLAAPLRRALLAARQHLEIATPRTAAHVLAELLAPAREVLGPEAGEAIAVAARAATMHL
jgi:hypothetical protein